MSTADFGFPFAIFAKPPEAMAGRLYGRLVDGLDINSALKNQAYGRVDDLNHPSTRAANLVPGGAIGF